MLYSWDGNKRLRYGSRVGAPASARTARITLLSIDQQGDISINVLAVRDASADDFIRETRSSALSSCSPGSSRNSRSRRLSGTGREIA